MAIFGTFFLCLSKLFFKGNGQVCGFHHVDGVPTKVCVWAEIGLLSFGLRAHLEGMANDKRIYKRISEKVKLKYRLLQGGIDQLYFPKDRGEGETEDMSEGGLLYNSKEPLPLGARLELELRFPDVKYVLYPKAKVVRIEEFGDGEYYEIGLEFHHLFDDDKQLILKHIELLGG